MLASKTPSAGTSPTGALSPEGVPTRLGGYRIDRRLGGGGMGVVYEGWDENLDRSVAVKLIARQMGESPEAVERFRVEAKAAARLSHPNIVTIYALGQEGETFFIAMERLQGENLQKVISDAGHLTPDEILPIIRGVAEGLRYGWRNNIVHRDIKPANIVVTEKGRAKILDFGLAKRLDANDPALTATDMIIGSPLYMSPEQAAAGPVDFRSDIYSLGITLYQAVTGKRPFDATSMLAIALKHAKEPLPETPELKAMCGGRLWPLIQRMAAKEPGDRHASYDELIAEIDRVMAVGVAKPGPSQRKQGDREAVVGRRLLVAAGVLGIVLLTIAGTAMLMGGDRAAGAAVNGGSTSSTPTPRPAVSPITRAAGGRAEALVAEPTATASPSSEVFRLPEAGDGLVANGGRPREAGALEEPRRDDPPPSGVGAAPGPEPGIEQSGPRSGRPSETQRAAALARALPYVGDLAALLRSGDLNAGIKGLQEYRSRAQGLRPPETRVLVDVERALTIAMSFQTEQGLAGRPLAEQRSAALAAFRKAQTSTPIDSSNVVRAALFLVAIGAPEGGPAQEEVRNLYGERYRSPEVGAHFQTLRLVFDAGTP